MITSIVNVLIEKSNIYNNEKVTSKDTGIVTIEIKVALNDHRNRKTTKITSKY